MNRKLLWAVLMIGLALVVAPLVMSLPSKANAGERMLNSFEPIMQRVPVHTTGYYYDEIFVPLGKVTPMMSAQNLAKFQAYLGGFEGMQTDAAKLVPLLAQAMNMTPAQLQTLMSRQLPAMAVSIFSRVPAGLDHYKPLVATMRANVENYRQVTSLPSFRLFAWFFIVPGGLLIVLAGYGLLGGWTRAKTAIHRAHPTPA